MKDRDKTILIAIRSSQEAAREAIKAWKRAERGKPVEEPVNRLYFTDEATLFKTLSTKRRELLKFLRSTGSLSMKRLSEQLGRDYKNVHSDIKLLTRLGLVDFDKESKVFVPWDRIALEIALAA